MILDTNVLISLITGTFAILGLYAASKFGAPKEDRVEQRSMRAEKRILEATCRSLEDYANILRGELRKAGKEVPPWPESLTETDGGQ